MFIETGSDIIETRTGAIETGSDVIIRDKKWSWRQEVMSL